MKKSFVILKQNSCIYKSSEYNLFDLDEVKKCIASKLKIIILDEQLYVKVFDVNTIHNNLEKFVDEKIRDFFPQNGELLYDYEKSNKRNELAIYSLKGGNRIKNLINNVSELEIKPIQYIIRDIMKKIINNKNSDFKVIVKIHDYFYYIYVKEGIFNTNYVNKNLEYILDKIGNSEVNDKIYIDTSIENDELFKKNFQIIKVNIGEVINEKVFKK